MTTNKDIQLKEKLEKFLDIEIPKDEYEAVKYNAEREIEKLTKEAREHEKKAREIRKRLNEVKPFAENTAESIAVIKAEDILKDQGKTPDEIKEFFSEYGITFKVV